MGRAGFCLRKEFGLREQLLWFRFSPYGWGSTNFFMLWCLLMAGVGLLVFSFLPLRVIWLLYFVGSP